MAKKYLSLDEVAERLGMSGDQVNQLRQANKLRGFADRGTWKFKSDEVDEYARASQVDSDPEVPIFDGGSSILGLDDLDLSGSSATIVKGSSVNYDDSGTPGGSDSDVRLIFDESIAGATNESALDVSVKPSGGSDSDVRLSDSASGVDTGRSDSDVRLAPESIDVGGDAGSDSDVKVVDDADSGGDFDFSDEEPDVKTVPEITARPPESFEEFDGTDAEMPIAPEGKSAPPPVPKASAASAPATPAESSDVVAASNESDGDVFAADSGIALDGDSGPVFSEDDDSGIALDAVGSTDADSGISLESEQGSSEMLVGSGGDDEEDDGIALFDEDEADDASSASGIGVTKPSDSGIALEGLLGDDAPDASRTVSMDALSDDDIDKLDGGSTGDTELEIAALSPDEVPPGSSEFQIEAGDDDAVTLTPSATGATVEMSDVDSPVASSDTFEMEDNALDESFEELSADDEFGDDEDFDEDVFDASEEDFDAAESQPEFAPAAARGPAGDYEFGTPAFVGLVATSCVLAVGAMVMVDLMRSIWAYREPSVGTSAILDAVKDLF